MNETQPALVNFTVETFPNERDMEFHLAQASKRFEVFMPKLQRGRTEEDHFNQDLEQRRQGDGWVGV